MLTEHKNMLGDLQAEEDQHDPKYMSISGRLERLEKLVESLQTELSHVKRKADYASNTAATLANGGSF